MPPDASHRVRDAIRAVSTSTPASIPSGRIRPLVAADRTRFIFADSPDVLRRPLPRPIWVHKPVAHAARLRHQEPGSRSGRAPQSRTLAVAGSNRLEGCAEREQLADLIWNYSDGGAAPPGTGSPVVRRSHRGRSQRAAAAMRGWAPRISSSAWAPVLYLEIIGPDPDQPQPVGGRWFGIDRLTAPRIVTWAIRTADIDAR